jgi:GAF domain-containing protein
MASWSISARGTPTVQVAAPNWIAALGLGVEELGRAGSIQRLACELLPNGTVIARDIATGTGFVVQQVDDVEEARDPTDELPTLAPDDLIELTTDLTAERGRFAPIDEAETPLAAGQIALLLARDHVPAESGAVILEEKGYLRFVSVLGPHARKLAGVRLPLGTGVAGFAMANHRTVVLEDAQEDPRHCGEIDALTGYRTKEIAVVPLVKGDRCYGVLELMNLPGGRRFTTEELEQLQSVASALASRLSKH